MNIGFQMNIGIRNMGVNKRPSLHRLHRDYFSMNNVYSHSYHPLYATHQFCVKSTGDW